MTRAPKKRYLAPRGLYKRWLDLAVMLSGHVLLLPIWIVLWMAIPLLVWAEDRGPVFYRQPRMGKGGRVFSILKFRTMVVDADRVGPRWNVDGDTRVTRVGRLLRRTAMDELPSLLAIWRGQMSLVGPRALDESEHRFLVERIPRFEDRLAVRPGLTGLSQVYNRSDEAFRKIELDRRYIETMSLWLDVKLIFLSIRNTLLGRWDTRSGKAMADRPDASDQFGSR